MEKALSVTKDIYELIRRTAATGMTEVTLFSMVEKNLNQLGYKKEQYLFDFLSGDRTARIDGGATEKKLEKGDLLLVDFSLQHEGVWCDTCRTFFFGTPLEEQASAYRLLIAAMKAGFQKIVPGISGEDVYRAALEPLTLRGMNRYMPHHAGHGIGENPFQEPVFRQGAGELLKAGDTVTLEPGLYFSGRWGIRIENDFLVTDDGAEPLFSYPLDLEYFILQ